jgi:hypothetical protein
MAHPTGETESDVFRLDFDRRLMLQFRWSPPMLACSSVAIRERVSRATGTTGPALSTSRALQCPLQIAHTDLPTVSMLWCGQRVCLDHSFPAISRTSRAGISGRKRPIRGCRGHPPRATFSRRSVRSVGEGRGDYSAFRCLGP